MITTTHSSYQTGAFFLSASDSGVGTNAFQITCPHLERLTITTTTSTVTSSTPATSPKPISTAKVTASLTSTRPSNIAPTTESESTSAVLEVKESVVRQDVPRESSTVYVQLHKKASTCWLKIIFHKKH